jgi:hypothetical protein
MLTLDSTDTPLQFQQLDELAGFSADRARSAPVPQPICESSPREICACATQALRG